MTHLAINIVAAGDPPPLEDFKDAIVEGKLVRFICLEKGAQSGKTSVAFVIEMPDGSHVFAQTTQGLLESMYCAMRGAIQRFGG